ncbi:MAG: response regulator [Planctomycetota bacterium]
METDEMGHDQAGLTQECPPTVYLVDDQEIDLELMKRWCNGAGLVSCCFDDPETLLATLSAESVGCVVADLRMPRIDGLELQAEIQHRGWTIPVILVTGHGDAENCRTAFQQGAFDFIEKGYQPQQVIQAIERAIRQSQRDGFQKSVREHARSLLSKLSPREGEVMRFLSSGMSLKQIATELNISVQTASKHRTSIFTKMRIDNEVDLYKTLLAAEIDS